MTDTPDPTKGFLIDMRLEGMKEAVALTVLRSRLKMAIRFKRTDSFALQAARGWAEKLGYGDRKMRTMNQALAWIEEMLKPLEEAMKAKKEEDDAKAAE